MRQKPTVTTKKSPNGTAALCSFKMQIPAFIPNWIPVPAVKQMKIVQISSECAFFIHSRAQLCLENCILSGCMQLWNCLTINSISVFDLN